MPRRKVLFFGICCWRDDLSLAEEPHSPSEARLTRKRTRSWSTLLKTLTVKLCDLIGQLVDYISHNEHVDLVFILHTYILFMMEKEWSLSSRWCLYYRCHHT